MATLARIDDTLIARILDMILHDQRDEINEALADQAGDETAPQIQGIRTFEEVGVLTTDEGLVIRLNNGQCVYLTIQVQ